MFNVLKIFLQILEYKLKFPSFTEYYNTIKIIEECVDRTDTLEDFFYLLEIRGLQLETVMTSDIAPMTLPIGQMKRKTPFSEVAPDNPKAEEFILKNKEAFKRRYGKNWEKVLYATAWKLFPNE